MNDKNPVGLEALAAQYLSQVIEAIEETSDREQRRPAMLALKLGVAGVVVLMEAMPVLLDVDIGEEDDDPKGAQPGGTDA